MINALLLNAILLSAAFAAPLPQGMSVPEGPLEKDLLKQYRQDVITKEEYQNAMNQRQMDFPKEQQARMDHWCQVANESSNQ
jgi:hypothetical protein